MIKKIISILIIVVVITSSCEKKYDTPPYKGADDGSKLSIEKIKMRVPNTNSLFKFAQGDSNLYCTVTADESSGNLFRQAYVKDEKGGALLLNLTSSGGLYTGDHIRINLNNLYVINAGNMISIDSIDAHKSIVKLSSGNIVLPKSVTISDILNHTDLNDPLNMQSQLVEINSVEFDTSSRNKALGDAIGKTSYTRKLTNCAFQQLSVRTSGFANFASKLCPGGSGKITGIISQYDNNMQLTLRQYGDIQMPNVACTSVSNTPNTSTFVLAAPVASLYEQFNAVNSNSDLSSPAWINYNQIGSVKWKGDLIMPSYKAAKATAFNSGNATNVIWLISQPIIYNSSLNFSFSSGFVYWDSGHPDALTAYVSTNFNGKNFISANWTKVSSALYADGTGSQYTGPAGLKASGSIPLQSISILNGYSGNFCIAFKYNGTSQHNSTIYLDDIKVQ
ncbi:MAG: choice-of-anchor J domain-containing protein [Bacteroidia bacterium]|nr:choice-of-anchor J domain-containing protein [Bacteroidia bacterium]